MSFLTWRIDMNVLIIYAHPEPKSLNGAILNTLKQQLGLAQHRVKVSDLYGLNWKSQVSREDFVGFNKETRLKVPQASGTSMANGKLSTDVLEEQEKLMWADTVIFLFPLWWYSMPAILKGWFDRVYSYGFAYGVGEHSDTKWGERFGEGKLQGKKAMLIVTAGGWKEHYSSMGINGSIDDILFPINHNMLFYPGFDVLPSLVFYQADRTNESDFKVIEQVIVERVNRLATTQPIAYRKQNFGDYTIPQMQLKPHLVNGKQGFNIHTE
jgi:NAD(P)H dehydrogenase (quinone)